MKKTLFLISTLLIYASHLQFVIAQDTSLIKYLPLRVGNIWVYYGYGWGGFFCGYSAWYDRYELTSTTQINGKTYYLFNHTVVLVSGYCNRSNRLFQSDLPIRVDSLSLNIYKSTNCGSSNELLVDSLKARLHDTSLTCYPQGNRVVCSDTSLYNVCGSSRPSKLYGIQGPEWSSGQRYAKNIGLVYFNYYWGEFYTITLRGSVINGVSCGDTTLTGITPISSEIPNKFSLYQNYPNPFNPATKIRFDIQSNLNAGVKRQTSDLKAGVRMIIYDILGKEVAALVNQSLKPGTYEVEWDASNYPSGVYYYKLFSGEYTETKKMALIK